MEVAPHTSLTAAAFPGTDVGIEVVAGFEAAIVGHLEGVRTEREPEMPRLGRVVGVLDQLVGERAGTPQVLQGSRDHLQVVEASSAVTGDRHVDRHASLSVAHAVVFDSSRTSVRRHVAVCMSPALWLSSKTIIVNPARSRRVRLIKPM